MRYKKDTDMNNTNTSTTKYKWNTAEDDTKPKGKKPRKPNWNDQRERKRGDAASTHLLKRGDLN